jgi:multiple sugar transport system ATP-binding protein
MAEVRLAKVEKRFGDFVAVYDATLTVKDREFVVLVGPSGCGKSTTLRMIAGLEKSTGGDIFIGDRLVNDVQPKDRDIAMVFQSYALYPHMSVFENMAFGLRLQRLPRAEIQERVAQAAQILELGQLLNRRPGALSGGQRQRVAMGRAIVRRPSVFLFDEPLSNLDARLRVQMRTEIARIHHRLKSTSIYVTHDQVEAMTLADRIVVMHEGKIQQVGSPLELYNQPHNIFVASFIGSPAMNMVDCAIKSYADQFEAVAPGLRLTLPPKWRHQLQQATTTKWVLGFRPQHVQITSQQHDSAIPNANLEVREPLGAETFLYLRNGEQMIIVRDESGKSYALGQNYALGIDPKQIHLFDKETGLSIGGHALNQDG